MKKFEILNAIYVNCSLSSKEILVVQYFVYKSNQKGICYPSVNTIAKECGVSERTVQRATKKLQEKGYIIIAKRTANGKQTSNEYRLAIEDIEDKFSEQSMQQASIDKMSENLSNELVCIYLEDMLLVNDKQGQECQEERELKQKVDENICCVEDIEDKSSKIPAYIVMTVNWENQKKTIIKDDIEGNDNNKIAEVTLIKVYVLMIYQTIKGFCVSMDSRESCSYLHININAAQEFKMVGGFENSSVIDGVRKHTSVTILVLFWGDILTLKLYNIY